MNRINHSSLHNRYNPDPSKDIDNVSNFIKARGCGPYPLVHDVLLYHRAKEQRRENKEIIERYSYERGLEFDKTGGSVSTSCYNPWDLTRLELVGYIRLREHMRGVLVDDLFKAGRLSQGKSLKISIEELIVSSNELDDLRDERSRVNDMLALMNIRDSNGRISSYQPSQQYM